MLNMIFHSQKGCKELDFILRNDVIQNSLICEYILKHLSENENSYSQVILSIHCLSTLYDNRPVGFQSYVIYII